MLILVCLLEVKLIQIYFILEIPLLIIPRIYPYIIEVDTGNGFLSCISNQNIQIIENDLNIDSIIVTNEVVLKSR